MKCNRPTKKRPTLYSLHYILFRQCKCKLQAKAPFEFHKGNNGHAPVWSRSYFDANETRKRVRALTISGKVFLSPTTLGAQKVLRQTGGKQHSLPYCPYSWK